MATAGSILGNPVRRREDREIVLRVLLVRRRVDRLEDGGDLVIGLALAGGDGTTEEGARIRWDLDPRVVLTGIAVGEARPQLEIRGRGPQPDLRALHAARQ